MGRSFWKIPYISNQLFQKKFLGKKVINIRKKNSCIPFIFKNNTKLCIFNGIWFLSIIINNKLVNNKLGEFIYTKKIDSQTHVKKKIQKKLKSNKK